MEDEVYVAWHKRRQLLACCAALLIIEQAENQETLGSFPSLLGRNEKSARFILFLEYRLEEPHRFRR